MEELAMGTSARKPHAVCVPFPAQSHINAMLKLAKLLNHKGFHITFVHSEYNYKRLLKSRGSNSMAGRPDFKFESIPDGLPPAENDDVTQDLLKLCSSTAKYCYGPFCDLLKKLNNQASADERSPPASCIICDCLMTFTLEAAEELGIPNVHLWTVSALSSMCYLHSPHLHQRGYIPLKDESDYKNKYLEQTVDWIPGIDSIRLRDLTTVWTTDPNDAFLEFTLYVVPRMYKASAFILNTFDALEYDVLKEMSTMVDHVYTIGPLHLLQKEVQKDDDHITESIQANLWKEDHSCNQWLDSKKTGSVVYVNFGSVTVIHEDQLVEFAWGLANSVQNFLWIIRPDLVTGGITLPKEFVEATSDRGMIANWCNQELVLNHPAVGVFLTHCGWNSVLESLSAGVPMICWPFLSDQLTNCLCCCSYWGVGVEIDSNVKRVHVERVVREVMEGHKGKEMKEKALEWKNKAGEAIRPTSGSSYLNLDKLIDEVLLQPSKKNFS